MSITDVHHSLIEDIVNAQSAAALVALREPVVLVIQYWSRVNKIVKQQQFAYDPQFGPHYLRTANNTARLESVWADKVEFVLLNRDNQPLVTSEHRRFEIPKTWMF